MRNNALRKIHFNAQELYKKEEQIHIAFFFSDQKSFYLFHVGSLLLQARILYLIYFFVSFFFTLIKEIVLFVDILKFSRNKKLSKICNKRNDIVILLHDDGV